MTNESRALRSWLRESLVRSRPDLSQAQQDLLLCQHFSVSRTQLLVGESFLVSPALVSELISKVGRLVAGEPLAYVLGKQGFHGVELVVDSRVLIPRPETEILVESALQIIAGLNTPDFTLIDVGIGSGAILLSVLAALSKQDVNLDRVAALGLDREFGALEVASTNARLLALDRFVTLIQGDLLTCLSRLPRPNAPQLVLANLPYLGADDQVQESVKLFEPASALWAENDGLALIFKLIDELRELGSSDCWLILEVGAVQAAKVESYLISAGYSSVRVILDLLGVERFLEAKV